MRQDFVTRLELQLWDAAAREADGRAVAGARRVARRVAPARLVAAGAAIALAVVAVLLGAAALSHRDTTPSRPGPRVIAHTTLADAGGTIVSAFGSVWVADTQNGRLLRVDPATRTVRARIAVGGPVAVNSGAGAVWAAGGREALRIDPRTNRIVARISVPGQRYGGVIPAGGAMWLIGSEGLARIDVRRNAVDRTVGTGRGGFQSIGVTTDGRSLYVMRADGRLLRYDARTGRRLASVRPAILGFPAAASGGSIMVDGDRGVGALDARSGRLLWTRDLGAERVNNSVLTGGTLWVQATDRATHRDRLWRIDARSGRVTGSLTLPAFGAAGMAAVGGRLWIVSPSGDLTVTG